METISQRRKRMETICVFYVISPTDSSNFPKGAQPFAEKTNLFRQALELSSFLANWSRLGFECCLKQLAAYGSIFIFWYSRVLSLSCRFVPCYVFLRQSNRLTSISYESPDFHRSSSSSRSRRRIKALFGHIAPAEASSQFRESSRGFCADPFQTIRYLPQDSIFGSGSFLKDIVYLEGIKPLSTLIVLGSGGHTAEMLNLLSVLHTDSFTPRLYIAAATDYMSLQKARLFENSVIDKEFRMAGLQCKLSRVSAALLYKIMFTAVPSGSNCCYVSTVAF
ncbi:hypothetical protein RHMOL_Rhmol07G0120800 [Rhododendron molle]|uniref:Uncharacterized protein n=1 Tax=Rhododendron molle TaxID=49168 RepID=A0ACC0N177_RHOML|nr:hypothetical protein RHMOL_Rhmol07G0120800 [Rhododendron molle]